MSAPALRRRAQHDAFAGGDEADAPLAQLHLQVAEALVDLLGREARQDAQLGARQGPLGDEEERLEVGDGGRADLLRAGDPLVGAGDRLVGAVEVGGRLGRAGIPGLGSPGLGVHCGRLVVSAAAWAHRHQARLAHATTRERQTMGPKGSSCSMLDLAALDQLQHGQERDGHDDPVAEVLEEVLEDDHGSVAEAPRG